MNGAVDRFIQEMGAIYAKEGDRDVSPILFKADDEADGLLFELFELTLPKGEPHPYWRAVSDYRIRGYVFNARVRNKWNFSVDRVI